MSKKTKSKTNLKIETNTSVQKTDSIWEKRTRELKSLQLYIKSLKKCITELESKIESEGLSGYYSQNHDCRRYSESIWHACLRLAMLKELDEEINGEDVK